MLGKRYPSQYYHAAKQRSGLTKACLICGGTAVVICPSRYARTKYCSHKCRLIGANRRAIASLKVNGHVPWSQAQRAKMQKHIQRRSAVALLNPKRRLCKSGYVYSRNRPGNERGEHRIIVERILGRHLKPKEVVHYIDLNRANNKNNNLVVCTPWLHGHMHHKMQQLWVKEHILALE